MIQSLIGPISDLLDKWIPDADKKAELAHELATMSERHAQELMHEQAKVIQSEAASTHWLAANWRPITMLTFLSLIVARWFGFAAPDLSEAEYLKLWSIVELGLGGYVIGRTIEKVAPGVIQAVKK